jgi:hypothetical protein
MVKAGNSTWKEMTNANWMREQQGVHG